MTTRKLIRIKFFAIRRELESTNRRQEDIAADYGVSSTTVSSINQARTWDNYLVGKKADKPVRSTRVKASDPVVRKEKATKAGLHPVTREERAAHAIVNGKNRLKPQETPAEAELAKGLDELTRPVLQGELRHIVGRIHERLDGARANSLDAIKSAETATVTSFVALFISIVAFVLSVIALVN